LTQWEGKSIPAKNTRSTCADPGKTAGVKRKPQGKDRARNPAVKTAAAESTRSACAGPGKDGGVKKKNTMESVDEMKNIKGAKDTKNFGNQGIDLKKTNRNESSRW
jgi:hypothetical protein